jgi:hemolysin D
MTGPDQPLRRAPPAADGATAPAPGKDLVPPAAAGPGRAPVRPLRPGRSLTAVPPAPVPAIRRRGQATRPAIDLDELWAPVRPGRHAQDRAFLPEPVGLLEAPASPLRIGLLYAICAIIGTGLLWSWFGHLDVYADASGIVQAAGDTKIVQPRQSGNVIAIRVHDGGHVKRDDILIELDPTEALANETVVKDSLDFDRAEIVRRRSEIEAAGQTPIATRPKIAWPESIPEPVREREAQSLRSDLDSLAAAITALKAQKAATEAERDKYETSLAPQQAVIDLIGDAFGMGREMFKSGWNSRLAVLTVEQQLQSAKLQLADLQGNLAQAKAAIAVIDSELAKTLAAFVNTNSQALLTAQQTEESLVEALAKAKSRLDDMTLRAPADGVVTASAVTSIGQVVTTGEQVMQVVPDGSPLEIVCYVLNTDAGFVRVGQRATIKVDTFDYTRYGTITGRVVKIAKDALTGNAALEAQKNSSIASSATGSGSITAPAQQTSDLVFPVTIVPERTTMLIEGVERPLTSGMTVLVEIKTQSRRAIDYILSPIQSRLGTQQEEGTTTP